MNTLCGDAKEGWVCTKDIGEVMATVLREGPEKHSGKDYYLRIEVLKMSEVAGYEIKINDINKEQ